MAYTICRSWEIQPSAFWQMSTKEFWLEFDMRKQEQDRMKENMPGPGGATQGEWDKARRKHKEMMEAKKNG